MESKNKSQVSALILGLLFTAALFVMPAGIIKACTDHNYQRCIGNGVYWYDSCGNQEELYQYCPEGCQSGLCSSNSGAYYQANCTYHAYRDCIGSDVYWFDSCGNRQELWQSCLNANQTCQYGQCVAGPIVPPSTSHAAIKCSGNSLYWYDSNGLMEDIYKNCADGDPCTKDTCYGNRCVHTLYCNGSTCAAGSQAFVKRCGGTANQNTSSKCGNGLCETNLNETADNCPADCKAQQSALSLAFLAKKSADSQQWEKTVQIGPNGTVYFLISVANNSQAQADNVSVKANIPTEIGYLGNIKINDTSLSGDIVSGINIGSIAPNAVKNITFEGKTQSFNTGGQKQAVATVSAGGKDQTDSFTLDMQPGQTGAVSEAPAAKSGLSQFLKRWYMWILAALVLIFLFVVVFRRLSKNY